VIVGPVAPGGGGAEEGVAAEAAGAEDAVLLLSAVKEAASAPIGVEDAILDVNLPMILWLPEGRIFW